MAILITKWIFARSLIMNNFKVLAKYEVKMSEILSPGSKAPEFSLPGVQGETVSLSQFKGKPVIIAFYPADWSPTCSNQMELYNEILPEFRKHQAELLGISVDGHWCHKAFAENSNLNFHLLSDFEPKGSTAKKYGADQKGLCERALFVVDKKGIIAWSYLSPITENPGADGILEALEKLKNE